MARWLAAGTHQLVEWETDLSSQTGASQAGILLGSNDDIPAFRWVEKETGTLMTCSAPGDCKEIERRHTNGSGLLVDGGTSRGNLLSGGAEEVILTVSRIGAERKANPGYRAFFANGHNVTRVVGALRRRGRASSSGPLPASDGATCSRADTGAGPIRSCARRCASFLRDLIVFSVISDMLRGRPAVYATLSGYDEVAHHSGLERHDTLETLRKLDKQLGRIARAGRYAPRPYEIVVLSDHGQTQGATFKQRNGYALDELVRRSIEARPVQDAPRRRRERDGGRARARRGPRRRRRRRRRNGGKKKARRPGRRRARVRQPRPRLPDGGAASPDARGDRGPTSTTRAQLFASIGTSASSSPTPRSTGPSRSALAALTTFERTACEGEDPLRAFSANAARHLARSNGFEHAPDLFVNSFYDQQVDEGCAFEELISFHGGMGGSQTRPFILAPVDLPLPERADRRRGERARGPAAWRALLNHGP